MYGAFHFQMGKKRERNELSFRMHSTNTLKMYDQIQMVLAVIYTYDKRWALHTFFTKVGIQKLR